jgi:hypothetical protein
MIHCSSVDTPGAIRATPLAAGWAACDPEEASAMATYRMVYGDDEQVVRETFENIDDVEREDGWVVLFRGKDAILRVQEIHVQSMERIDP